MGNSGARRGPQGGVDRSNETVSCVAAFFLAERGGGQAPLGGTAEMSSHKGYGLALMVHILGGTLSGASFSPIRVRTQKDSDPDRIGHFFPAIDPAQPVLVAGDPEAAAREQRLRDGIPMPSALLDNIRAICERSGIAFLL